MKKNLLLFCATIFINVHVIAQSKQNDAEEFILKKLNLYTIGPVLGNRYQTLHFEYKFSPPYLKCNFIMEDNEHCNIEINVTDIKSVGHKNDKLNILVIINNSNSITRTNYTVPNSNLAFIVTKTITEENFGQRLERAFLDLKEIYSKKITNDKY